MLKFKFCVSAKQYPGRYTHFYTLRAKRASVLLVTPSTYYPTNSCKAYIAGKTTDQTAHTGVLYNHKTRVAAGTGITTISGLENDQNLYSTR